MGIIIDSSVLIAAERGKLDLRAVLQRFGGETVSFSIITASELLHGEHRATSGAIRAGRSAFVEGLLARFPVLPIDMAVARKRAEISAALATAGKPVGAHDLLIAASAMARGDRVVTRDARSFPLIPGLLFDVV